MIQQTTKIDKDKCSSTSCIYIHWPHLHVPDGQSQFSHLHPWLPHPLPKLLKKNKKMKINLIKKLTALIALTT